MCRSRAAAPLKARAPVGEIDEGGVIIRRHRLRLSAASGFFALIAGLALLPGGATRSYGTVTSNDAPDDGGGHGADDAPDAPDDRGVDV